MNLSAVLIRHTRHGASADARFALRDVLRHAPAGVRVILGAETLDAHELLTGDPDGRVLVLRSPVGMSLTNVAFGGPDRKTLYCTESVSGSILRSTLDTAGLPLARAIPTH